MVDKDALIGKVLYDVGVVVPFDEVKVGDVVLFTLGPSTLFPAKVIDADPVVKIDEKGIHFAGGTYIAPADKVSSAEVVIVKPAPKIAKANWWNAGRRGRAMGTQRSGERMTASPCARCRDYATCIATYRTTTARMVEYLCDRCAEHLDPATYTIGRTPGSQRRTAA